MTAEKDGEIFFYLPSDYPREVKIRVNGQKVEDSDTFYGGESDRIVSLGVFSAGETVSLSMTLKADVLYVKQKVEPFYYLNMDVFEDSISRIAETQLTVGEKWTDSYLPGTITTGKDSQLIMTTIAYDAGWQVTVDGKRVDTTEVLEGVVAFTIDNAGEHTVVMKYRPKAFTLGLTVTILSILLFVFIMIFEKQLKAILARICADSNNDTAECALIEENSEECDEDEIYEDSTDDIPDGNAPAKDIGYLTDGSESEENIQDPENEMTDTPDSKSDSTESDD